MLVRQLVVLSLIAAALACGAQVVKIGKTPDIVFTPRAGQNWQTGDSVCVHRGNSTVGCGSVVATNANHAAIRLEPGAGPAQVGDEVRAAGRNTASQTTGTFGREGRAKYSQAQISVELGGASLIYSLFGSYRFAKRFALNAGFSYLSVSGSGTGTLGAATTASVAAIQIPASLTWLALGEENSFLEVLGGVDAIFASGSSGIAGFGTGSNGSSAIVPEFGVGYRYWPRTGGFHFRATAYAILSPGSGTTPSGSSTPGYTTTTTSGGIKPWGGLTLGYAF